MTNQEELPPHEDRGNPFPGLRSFNEGESHLFYGRTVQTDELLRKLQQSRFTAVLGTSGSGKSSLVRAGLLAALERGFMAGEGSRWRIATFRPVNDPIGNLASALIEAKIVPAAIALNETNTTAAVESMLRHSSLGLVETIRQSKTSEDENILIVVDQFEELFRFKTTFECENPADEAAAFVKLLLRASQQREIPIYIVLTMRSDYLGESAKFSGLPEAINVGQYLVPRMNDDERREAITYPILMRRASITEPLVNRLLNDAGDDPENLPLLQHAVMRTWDEWAIRDERAEQPLDISHYDEIGGLRKALSNHADEAFASLSDAEQETAKKVFKALTGIGPDGRGIRTPRTFGELCAIAAQPAIPASVTEQHVGAVIKAYRREGRSFLMPPPPKLDHSSTSHESGIRPESMDADTLIDISHESLIKGWGQLEHWVQEEADSGRTYQRLAERAIMFDLRQDKRLSTPALPMFLKWRDEKQKPNAAWARRYFDPNWAHLFKEGGATDTKFKNEFERATAFLDESLEAENKVAAERAAEAEAKKRLEAQIAEYEHRVALDTEKQRRLLVMKWATAVLSLLLLFALGASGVAAMQWKRAQTALVETRMAQHKAEEAEQQTRTQLKQTEAAKQEAEVARVEAETQKKTAEAATEEAIDAKAEADKQRDAAKASEEAAIKSREEALNQKAAADKARALAIENQHEADQQRLKAVKSAAEAKQEKKNAEDALAEAKVQRLKAEAALNELAVLRLREGESAKAELKDVQTSLKSVDSKTPHFAAIIRHDQTVNTATFNSADQTGGKRVMTTSADGQGYFSELKNDEFGEPVRVLSPRQFGTNDVLDEGSLISKLKNAESPLSAYLLSNKFSQVTRELLEQSTSSTQPDPKIRQALVNEFNNLLKDPLLYSPERFKDIKLRDETSKLITQKPQGSELLLLNRMLLEDAYSQNLKKDPLLPLLSDKGASVAAFSPDGSRTAIVKDNKIVIFDLNGSLQSLPISLPETGIINKVAFSPQGHFIVSTSIADNFVRVWEAQTGKPMKPMDLQKPASVVVFSQDEKYLAATTSNSREAKIWEINDPSKSVRLPEKDADFGKGSAVNTIAFNQDGSLLLTTAEGDNDVRMWDAKTGKLKRILTGHRCQAATAEFDKQGEQVVAASDDGSAIVWNLETGKKYELRGYRGLLIYGSKGGIHQIFPVPQPFHFNLKPKEGEYIPLNTAKFSNDGKMVVTASTDGKVRVWKLDDKLLAKNQSLLLQGYSGNVLSAEFGWDDKYVIAAGADGAARVWNIGNGLPDKASTPKSCDDAREIRRKNPKR